MVKAEYLLLLPNGEYTTYEEVFSQFEIYAIKKRLYSYILIPKTDKDSLKGVIIVANESGIRICRHKSWPKKFVSHILKIAACKNNKLLIKIDCCRIPTDLQGSIVAKLVKQIL